MTKTNVAVLGAYGKLGSEVVKAVAHADDLELYSTLDSVSSPEEMIGAKVIVDVTTPEASKDNVFFAIEQGIHCVVGTSGWNQRKVAELEKKLSAYPEVGVFIAPNFALGSVLATSFAAKAAQFFESVEIIEMHHPQKRDAPSGTAVHTAERIAAARNTSQRAPMLDATSHDPEGARGAKIEGIPVHAVRLSGLIAHQEVLLGNPGEQLVIRHDSFDRASLMPGVLHGIREVSKRPGLTVGLDKLLDL